ncbi:type II toxin-antitoxin system Phd/YefM family antitoxin [Streptosporangium canum]|uniref:type II toxin-antitoxin system Phd/YefM family antitoxin n=1 Tax=Streptosporangium canum TaxID=324952 RepID=UPI0036D0570E
MTTEETPAPVTPPLAPGPEVESREARTRLGELADRARYLDEVTYLTKNGTRVAAVVPFEAARTRERLRRVHEIAVDEVAAMLGEAETTPPAQAPDDVTGHCEKQIWAQASAPFSGPLITSMHALGEGLHLSAWWVQRALVEPHTAGRVRLYRYFRGYQSEVGPAQLHEKAGFHLVGSR